VGKTPTPLVIWVDIAWVNHPQIVDLRGKGHRIVEIGMDGDLVSLESPPPDLILSRASWNWDDDMFDEKGRNLETTLKAARKRVKSGKTST